MFLDVISGGNEVGGEVAHMVAIYVDSRMVFDCCGKHAIFLCPETLGACVG